MNGIGHPLFAVASGGYFPGLITSPLIGVAGVVLWGRLLRATAERLGDSASAECVLYHGERNARGQHL
ncbi:MAG: hypothetical protein HYV63_19595 [Candidatus Schekmanbacteria bacterium]|nr:hypothetical protein [Candidatus Schekmanbacteria bacterium]